jgi:hypothetical protein
MKNVLAGLVVLAMVSGCCTLTDINGVETKSFLNCLKAAQDKICNPPAVVIDMAKLAAPIIKTAISLLVPGSAEYLAAIDSAAAIDSILNTGCVGITNLNKLVAFLQTDAFKNAQAVSAVAKMKMAGAMTSPISVQPFIDWRNSAK